MCVSGEELTSGTPGVAHLLQPKQPDEQADKELVKCISECSDVEDYLYHPPINQCTLHFLDGYLEEDYRSHCWGDSTKTSTVLTFSLPHITSLFDMVVSFVFFLFISLSCFIAFSRFSCASIAVFVIGLLLELLVLVLMLLHVFLTISVSPAAEKAGQFMSSWYPRHLLGGLIASLPTIVVFSLFSCDLFKDIPQSEFFYCLLIIASLLHFCNFTMLCSLMKSSLATVACLILVILLAVGVCPKQGLVDLPACTNSTVDANSSSYSCHDVNITNSSTVTPTVEVPMVFSGNHSSQLELIFDVALLLLLLCFLNREIEIGYRVCYHGDVQAVKDRQKIETEKEQADWLLHNIVPEHVADLLKHHDRYCKNHKDVGVIFAKISNFDDFYDESFEGGKEYLRVLNELMGDFEDLFDEPKYRDVEKIKTIGSCLMAASGLNPQTRNQNKDPNAHLYALMDFSIDILRKLEEFNKDIFNFDFEMAVGYNFGEVTAGVIGTTKLLYDIWGDTVNIASRMYSTGVHERIQVTEDTAKKLSDKFDFEYRGQTYVKGKGDMNTYLLVGKKPGATWD